MKKFIAGLLTGILLMFSIPVMAETVKTIEVYFDRVKLEINGQMTDTPTLLYDGRTYIQLRGAAEAFDAELAWNGDTNIASLITTSTASAPDVSSPEPLNQTSKEVVFNSDSEIKTYLDSNYSEFDTSQGKCKVTFSVMDNWTRSNYDFQIEAKFESSFFFDKVSSIAKISSSQKSALIEELKKQMEKIAKDLIEKLPGKKLKGNYNYYWWDYPTIMEGLNSYDYCSWSNYPYNYSDSYESTQASNEIYWNVKYDD